MRDASLIGEYVKQLAETGALAAIDNGIGAAELRVLLAILSLTDADLPASKAFGRPVCFEFGQPEGTIAQLAGVPVEEVDRHIGMLASRRLLARWGIGLIEFLPPADAAIGLKAHDEMLDG